MIAIKCIPKNGFCDLLVDWRDFESVCYSIPSRDGKILTLFYHFWPILYVDTYACIRIFAQMRMFRMFCMLPPPNGHSLIPSQKHDNNSPKHDKH